jgi:hypothetical protein
MLKRSKYDMPAAQNFADPSARQMELDAFEQQRQAYNDEMTRLMAKGGEVSEDPQDKAARSIIKDFEGYGYTKEEIMGLADQVAAAGRGGDELLAYLSPESVRFLKENGGSGTINPVTGLSEFKGGGGFIGEVIQKIGNAFSPSSSGTSSLDQGEEFAKAQVATIAPLNGPISPEQAAARAELEAQQRGAKAQPAFVPPTVGTDSPYYSSPEYRAYIEKNSGPLGPIGTADMYDSPYFGTVGSGSLGKQNDRAYESYLGRLTQEAQRERDAADAAARAQAEREAAAARERMIAVPVIGTPAPPTARDQLEQMPAPPTAPPPYTESPPAAPPQLTPIAPPSLPTPRARNAVSEFISRAPETTLYTPPVLPGQIRLPGMGGSASQFAADIPISMPAMPSYTSRGIGAVGPVNAATSNYFAMTPQTSTGLAPGSAAIGSPDMPMYGARNTMSAIGSSPNLSPTMLGGAQNAGFFMDRMGNRITAPGMAPISRPFGFAQGGEVGRNFGFKPPSNSVNSMETVTWYNPKTGQTYVASSGGYTPPSNDWVVRGAENRGGGSRQTAPEGAPGEGFNPSPGFARSMLDAGKALSNYPVMAPFGMPLKAIGSLANTYGSYLSTVAERNATAKNVEAGAPSGSLQAQPSRVLSQLRSNEAYGPGPDGPDGPGNDGRGGIRGVSGVTAGVGERGRGGMGADRGSNPGDPGRGGGGAHLAKGGEVDLEALMAQNAETLSDEQPEETTNTNPVGTAQQMLSDLSGAGKASPTRQAIKRTKTSSGGGADADKAMQMAYEDLAKGDLGAMKDRAPAARNTESARSQMEELARIYQLKIRSAQQQARGLSADTFGAPTLEGPTLTKNQLTKNRFKDGGEAKKAAAESAKEPGIFSVSSYAADASERMFPDQLGQDDQRDAARHMLAAAALSKKVGPDVAAFLGKVHERTSNPESFFSMFGIGKPRDDYELDVHNNKLGVDLASRTTSQADLEKLVRAMALQAQTKKVEGKPYIMGREQMDARKAKAAKGMTPPPEYRAEGSPEEGEESLDKFYVPKARPSTGLNRKKGPVSQAIDSGEAYVNMAKGATELPYDILGSIRDVSNMIMTPFGYGIEKPVGGSDFIKEKMTQAGIRQAPPTDPTAKGFYTAGELLSNLTNPAGVTRAAVKGAEKTGKAATAVAKDFQQYNQQLSAPGASYAVRPTGSTMLTGPVGLDKTVSNIDQLLQAGVRNSVPAAGRGTEQQKLIEQFWDTKARNYFTRQFGTPNDPIATAISKKQIKGTALEEAFPEYMLDQIAAGTNRVNAEGQERFFPKYPRAMEDFTLRYDKATGLKGNLLVEDSASVLDPGYSYIGSKGREVGRNAGDREADKMVRQGVRPEMINTEIGVTTRDLDDPAKLVSDGTPAAKDLYAAFQDAVAYNKMTPAQKTEFNKGQYFLRTAGMTDEEVGKGFLAENVRTAIEKGEPVYDIGYSMGKPLEGLFRPENINEYLATLNPRQLANIRFEDAVSGGLKMKERAAQLANVEQRIRDGKPVADAVFSDGVSAPLLQFGKGSGLEGFAWKRIEKREATIPEGAYVGHSVGGYEKGGPTYTKEKRDGFNTGKYEVYTLRDNRNRPVNTIEVTMMDEVTPIVTQIKGNGRATGNVPAEKYDGAVLRFLQDYLMPVAIEEEEKFLTPLLQNYKIELGPSPRAPAR